MVLKYAYVPFIVHQGIILIKREDYKQLFEHIGERFIIGGDFNAKHTHWGSRLINPKDRELFNASNELGCKFVSTRKSTYWPTHPQKIPDLIDFFVTRKISNNYLKIEEGHDLNSDHSPIYLTVSSDIAKKESIATLCSRHTDCSYFR